VAEGTAERPLDAVSRRDQLRFLGLLALLCAASWAWSFRMAADVEDTGHHHHGSLLLLAVMWGTMMVAMMVPPEVPRLLWLLGTKPEQRRDAYLHTTVFLVGYLLPWMLLSLLAAVLQARLDAAGLLTSRMATASRGLGAGLLLVAGLMQLSPLKRACLERCRLRAARESPGPKTALEALVGGIGHGGVSVGSCGVLMLVLFVTGVMSPWAMALLTAFLVLENLAPSGWPVARVGGLLLLVWGGVLFLV
jgi:predicted metal-binding membrane protein